jgi:hypothetical protein
MLPKDSSHEKILFLPPIDKGYGNLASFIVKNDPIMVNKIKEKSNSLSRQLLPERSNRFVKTSTG